MWENSLHPDLILAFFPYEIHKDLESSQELAMCPGKLCVKKTTKSVWKKFNFRCKKPHKWYTVSWSLPRCGIKWIKRIRCEIKA